MTDPSLGNPTPQFGTAEYVGHPESDHCQYCHLPIVGRYYRANGALACPSCAQKMSGELAKDTHAAYVRALLFGTGAAILGMILYATFAIVTGIVIGYASLAVGWLIGKAMAQGSSGIGGRRYQIAAVLLTYAAVSTAAIPIWIHYSSKHKPAQQQQAAPGDLDSDSGQQSKPSGTRPAMITALGTLLLLGLASPFLEFGSNPVGALIGLFILFIGMRFAWQMTGAKPLQVYGPFESAPR
jgi:hypothetical protein